MGLTEAMGLAIRVLCKSCEMTYYCSADAKSAEAVDKFQNQVFSDRCFLCGGRVVITENIISPRASRQMPDTNPPASESS